MDMPTNSELNAMINERIHSKRDRNIMRRKMIDGITYEALAEEVGMSARGVKYVVQRNRGNLV